MDLAKPKTAFAVVLQVPARHSPCQAGERVRAVHSQWQNGSTAVCYGAECGFILIVNAGCIQSQLIRISLFLEGQFNDIQT